MLELGETTVRPTVSVQPLEVYTKLYTPNADAEKLTDATPPLVAPNVAPAGLPVCTDHIPVVGLIPVMVAVVPAQTPV